MDIAVLVAASAAIALGLAGTVVARLPGVVLIWSAVLVWSAIDNSPRAWTALGVATVVALADYVLQNVMAGRRLADIVAPARSVAVGLVAGTVGLALARTLGMVAGFVFGTYLAERRRLRRVTAAIPAGTARSRGSLAVEVASGLLVTSVWLVAVAG